MNFQGRLTDASGNTMPNGTYNMRFRIYSALTGGTQQWTENRANSASTGVAVVNGLFSVQLGDVTSLPPAIFTNQNLYFEIELPTPATATCSTASCESYTEGPMGPRNKLGSSAYAFNSDTLDGMDSADFAAASGSGNYIQNTSSPQTANFNINGVGTIATLRTASIDTATATTLTIGATNATSISIAENMTVAAGKTIRMIGGITSLRPASPGEGAIFYDTTTKQLLTYANGKWQSDRSSSSKIVAASNSPQAIKDSADYVADGTADEVEINAALTAASSGGSVYLAEGLYTVASTIFVPNNTTLQGNGTGTEVQFANIGGVNDNLIEASGTTRTGQIIRDLKINGRNDTNSQTYGIVFTDVGAATGSSGAAITRMGATISGVTASNFGLVALQFSNSSANKIINNQFQNNGGGVTLSSNSFSNLISGNTISQATAGAFGVNISLGSNDNTASNNVITSQHMGITVGFAQRNKITGNYVSNSAQYGICLCEEAALNIVESNTIIESGGTTSNNGIYLDAAFPDNKVMRNYVEDTSHTSSNFAISISGENTYVSDNFLNYAQIDDSGTDTVYVNQLDSSGKLITRSYQGIDVQGSSGASIFRVDAAASQVKVIASVAPTADMMIIDNSATPTVTNNVNGLSIKYAGGNVSNREGAGARVDYTPGTSTNGKWSGLRIVAGPNGAANSVTSTGIKLDGPTTPGGATGYDIGMQVASGWEIGIDIQSGGLRLANQADPGSAAANNLQIYAQDIAGRMMPKWVGDNGVDTPFQASLGFNRVSMIMPAGGSTLTTAVDGFGTAFTNVGTVANPTPSSSSLLTSVRRTTFSTGTAIGAMASHRQSVQQVYRGNVAGRGGFFFTTRFGTSALATGNRAFVGLTNYIAAPTNVDPLTDTRTSYIGLGTNSNTGNWSIVSFGIAQTAVNLGANFPVNSTNLYELVLYSAPNGSNVGYRVRNLTTNQTTAGAIVSQAPVSTHFMAPNFWITNNASAASATIDFAGWYLESDN